MRRRFVADLVYRLRAILLGVILWLAFGLGLVFLGSAGSERPATFWQWVIWSAAAPVVCLFLELVAGLLFAGPGRLISRVPPFSWVLGWLRCDRGVGDPILRFGALAVVFLMLFFLALRIIFDYP